MVGERGTDMWIKDCWSSRKVLRDVGGGYESLAMRGEGLMAKGNPFDVEPRLPSMNAYIQPNNTPHVPPPSPHLIWRL